MCFSASASFIASTVLSTAGVATIQKPKKKTELPLAVIPLLFGIQQLIEGLVWLSLQHTMPRLNIIATYGFVFFSHILWPILVPIAIFLVEPVVWRRKVMSICVFTGVMASVYVLYLITFFPLRSEITHHSIKYIFPLMTVPFFLYAAFYLMAVCASCLFSSHRIIKLLGMLAIIFLGVAYYFYTVTLASVWCFFAAILSLIIYFFFSSRYRK